LCALTRGDGGAADYRPPAEEHGIVTRARLDGTWS